MADKLAALLEAYRDGADVIPSEWVFPSARKDGLHVVDVKNDKEGAGPAHRLRHTFKTTLTDLGVTTEQSRLLMGHSMRGDISRDYITAPLVVNSLREITNVLAQRYINIIGLD